MSVPSYKTLVLDLLRADHHDEAAFYQELGETECAAIGTPNLWSVKDHLAHRNFWNRHFVQKVTAILHRQEVPPIEGEDDEINGRVFEEQKLRPWSELRAEAEQLHAALLQATEQLSEDDLSTAGRFPWFSRENPLYPYFLGNCYEHNQEHLAQYYTDRHNLARATHIREQCASRILQTDLPAWIKGSFLYNLACFYAQFNQREQASARLQAAITFDPALEEHAKSDPDLAALRATSA